MILKNLRKLRKEKKLTLLEVANVFHCAEGTMSSYETGRREPNGEIALALANFYGVSLDYLCGNEDKNETKGVKIPVLGTIPAGVPIEAVQDILDYEEIPQSLANTGDFFALKVRGDSMSPTILEGDVVIIRKQEDAESGKVCVVMINGFDATLKEIKKEPNGLWVLPHNPNSDFKPTFFSNNEVLEKPVVILGFAIEIRRNI